MKITCLAFAEYTNIEFQTPATSHATVQWLETGETTFDLEKMERKERWQYYVSSYSQRERTEGVDIVNSKSSSLLINQIGRYNGLDEGRYPDNAKEDLQLHICVYTSKIKYKAGTSDFSVWPRKPPAVHLDTQRKARNERFNEKFVRNNKWMEGKSHDEVQQYRDNFKKLADCTDSLIPSVETTASDTVME